MTGPSKTAEGLAAGGVSSQLWAASAAIARACLEHPFLRGLADGTLPDRSFRHYVAQDAYFLEAFARAYCVGAAKSSSGEDLTEFHALAGGALEERRLHRRYAEDLGIDLAVSPWPATRRYTDFLVATAWSADHAQLAAAMTPCMRLYAYLGQRLAASETVAERYRDWVDTYSAPEFDDLAVRLEALLDRHATTASEVAGGYAYALDCELAFFTAAWNEGTRSDSG